MDKIADPKENRILEAAVQAARNLGIEIQVDPNTHKDLVGGDGVVHIACGEQNLFYVASVRHTLHPATLGVALEQIERLNQQQVMLVTDYVSPALADELRARDIAFLDTAGNAYIKNGPFLVWVKGQKRLEKNIVHAAGRAFQPTGLQLLFTLLCNPQTVNRSYRELGEMSGVAHGTVGWAMPDLQQLGYIRDLNGKRGTRHLFNLDRLLEQWVDAYVHTLRPRTLLARYFVPTLEGWKDWPLAEHGALWGGEPAAALLTGYLRPGVLTLYAEKMPNLLAARQKFMKEPASGHTAVVEVRKRFWNFPAESGPGRDDLVPPLLVYADLLATGDARCIETARMIYENHIARLFT
jgi:hypothetical protein